MQTAELGTGKLEEPWEQTGLPVAWGRRWTRPRAEDRPLQIIHGIEPVAPNAPGADGPAAATDPDAVITERLRAHRERGMGGIVCNVSFSDYLCSEPAWRALVTGIESCRRLGLVAWIYDEKGYPSMGAGGLVLRGHPEYEAQALTYDATLAEPLAVRAAYEFTHASNNYHAARRYPNLLDDRAVRRFIEVTHEAYRQRLGDRIGSTIRAFFTDEPSLITVNLGQIPEAARRRVPVDDPPDPDAKPLPSVPWVYDLPERYRERYGTDLMAVRGSLFAGDTDADRAVRERYWALIADLVAERYFGAIQRWCAGAGVASSGHNLWEEAILHHTTLYGNGLKALTRFDIPGLDELSSDPGAVLHGHWMTAALPASAAILTGRRRVFTEVSDFSQKMAGTGPATLPQMQATAAWQAAFGVTEFTLYYNPADRSPEDSRAYADCVGRLNAILRPAKLDPDVLLYYPIRDLWQEYRPVATPITADSQTTRARAVAGSFNRLGQALACSQIPFALVDHEFLAAATVRRGGALALGGHRFRALVLPEGVDLPEAAARAVTRFAAAGGTVCRDAARAPFTGPALAEAIRPPFSLAPATDRVVLGRFVRGARRILLLVNAGTGDYAGVLRCGAPGAWLRLDPATGAATCVAAGADGNLPLALCAHQAAILVDGAGGGR